MKQQAGWTKGGVRGDKRVGRVAETASGKLPAIEFIHEVLGGNAACGQGEGGLTGLKTHRIALSLSGEI